VAYLGIGQAEALAIKDELAVFDEFHAMQLRESFGAFADEVDVGTFFEDQAGGVDGIAEALNAGYAAGFHAAAVHEEGIELDAAVGGKEAAAASVEGGIVFEDGDGCLDGVDGCAATGEYFMTYFEGAADSGLVGGCEVGRDCPGSAMN
jgi:hypothetical protein